MLQITSISRFERINKSRKNVAIKISNLVSRELIGSNELLFSFLSKADKEKAQLERKSAYAFKSINAYAFSFHFKRFSNFETEIMMSHRPPTDKYNVVYCIILLHGIGALMTWNMFITIAPVL
ncbi:unnamed protein product [Enterobius vermicularis]|uniref:7TM_GPCR_Srx domain-containing protein n=1 Tax=Enterobius vermicularis TaxID=51028 RepID=A0A158QB80_ENTVE|nr:unnamed protein product [Enterobius vermicularis]